MTRNVLPTAFVVGTCMAHLLGQGQPGRKSLAFEVASVKSNTSGTTDFNITGFGTSGPRPSQFLAKNAALDRILTIAFGVRDEQLINLPGWTHTDRFDIAAKYPSGASYDPRDVMGMLRSLLSERFTLHTHGETRELPVYDLVLARR